MRIAERTLADLLEPLLKAQPQKKKLDALELVQAPEKRRLMLLTVTDIDCGA